MRIPDLKELQVRKSREREEKKMANAQTKAPDPDVVLMGPLPYNRFLGNPPIGVTAEEAFKAEMGYDYLVQFNAQPVLDKIHQLESKNADLQAQVTKLQAEVTNLQAQAAQHNTKPQVSHK